DLIGYHVWRQTQTQTVINNFYSGDFCIFNPKLNDLSFNGDGLLRMEFPLYQWLIALTYKCTTNSILVTRIFTFIVGLFSMLGFYDLCKSIFKDKFLAAVGAWIICFSPIFYYYTINPLPDNMALCFGIFALNFFVKYYETNKRKWLVFFGIMLCLSTLCKLPFILYVVPFVMFWFSTKRNKAESLIVFICLLPALIWYALVIGTWQGNGVVRGVLDNPVGWVNYLDYVQFNLISTLPELFINYAALLVFVCGLYFLFKRKVLRENKLALFFMMGLLAVFAYLFYELNLIAKVHDYYLFPFMPFLFLITVYGFKMMRQQNNALKIVALFCIVLMPLTAYVRSQTRWDLIDPGFNVELLNNKQKIQAIIPANAMCLAGNDDSKMIWLYYLNRKGYTFYYDDINVASIEDYKSKGVSYLVCDAKLNEETKQYLKEPLATFNTVVIYKLK
ncbi:MAG TPA: glycosyltransferase family 39 protein, partial [Bacteroidia bacterium]|nr:glycosyltransferase family 39 protein [Bacteroidia bacterium]